MSFRAKILFCVSILLAFSFSLGAGVLIARSVKTAVEDKTQSANEAYNMIIYTLDAVNSVSELGTGELVRVTLSQLDDRELQGWEALRLYGEEHVLYESGEREQFAAVPLREGMRCMQTSVTDDGRTLLQISGGFSVGEQSYALDVLFDISTPFEMRDSLLGVFRRVFVGLVLAGLVVSLALSFFLSHPLVRLSAAARRIARGELDYRASHKGNDEIAQLAADLNVMADRLSGQIGQLEQAVDRQELFMGSFAHEMKTPMTSIIGYADLLRSRELSEAERREAANYIYSEARRLESLSAKLLELIVAGKDDFVRTEVELDRYMREIGGELMPNMHAAGIRLSSHGQGRACIEPDLIKSLLFNLADNARKAQPEGGFVSLEAGEEPTGVTFTVTDGGIGIPPAAIAHLTEVFWRVDKSRSRAQGGAGLGLSLCKRIVELHGGHMHFESTEGRGTTVTVYIPTKAGERK